MRGLLKPLVLPWLRRDPGEITGRARRFAIRTDSGRELVGSLGDAFLGGYHAMLERERLSEVARDGARISSHFRPFFFEGAAMGYLPRCTFDRACRRERIEQELLELDPAFRYLYYVGIGFWYGFRHPRRPAALLRMAPHLSPLYFPLCFDGYGFKVGFFDFPRTDPSALLARVPAEHRSSICQGLGRALFFVTMNDPAAFAEIVSSLPAPHREDLVFGRGLAAGFTGINHPDRLVRSLAETEDASVRAARLTGITWALTARRMNDRDYYRECLERGSEACREFLEPLPDLCLRALEGADSYGQWQGRTRRSVVDHWTKTCADNNCK